MKILCICEHGNIRSVGLAYILKTLFKHEAIAVGFKELSDETLLMLENWADIIVILTDEYAELGSNKSKVIYFNIGKDIWFDAKAQGLVHKLYKELSKHPELWK